MILRSHYISKSQKETQKIASQLAKKIRKLKPSKNATVIGLEGELGAGKTVFIKGFAKEFGIKGAVNSPTFVLIHPYDIKGIYKKLYHIDAYRIKTYKDLISLGIKEILADSENIVLIEWSERVEEILPKNHIKVRIDHIDEKTRKIIIKKL